jgi:Tannase and feruloyl esterase
MATIGKRRPDLDRQVLVRGVAGATAFAAAILAGTALAATTCDVASMQAAAPKDTTIVSAEKLQTPVPHCKVDGYVTTTNPGPNRNNFRLQLPDRESWNHRFYFIGLGGSGGFVPTESQTPRGNPIVKGFAVAGTDKGHQTDALDWSFNNDPAKALDNAHRGGHVTTVAAQQLTRAYYAADKMYRYETGCSGGGEMGIEAMQHHPGDYDGVLLGWPGGHYPDPKRDSPAINFNVMVREMTREPGSWLSPAKRRFAEEKVTAACDLADGAKDDMIWDHRLCKFDFSALKCKAGDAPDCLTQPEITSFNNLLRDSMMPISNISMWSFLGNTPPPWDPSPSAENASKTASSYVILNGWARTNLKQPDRDILKTPLTPAEVTAIEAGQVKASNSVPGGTADLSAYEKAGGKALFFGGVSDPVASNLSIETFFQDLNKKMGAEKVAKVAELYEVPGWGHCGGGTGPVDGQDQMLGALIDWVEKGKAPMGVEMHRGADRARMMFAGVGGTNAGVPVPESKGASRDFLVCPYPLVSVFDKSKADVPSAVYDARNWSCRSSRE